MTDRDAFLAGILANPDADLPRLILADWLDEQGNESDSERAEFVRVSCEVAAQYRGERLASPENDRIQDESQRRERELFVRHGLDWFADGQPLIGDTAKIELSDEYGAYTLGVRRGFVEVVRAPLAWLIGGECEYPCGPNAMEHIRYRCLTCDGTGRTPGHLREILAAHPVTTVVVTDREPYRAHWSDVSGWRRDDGRFVRPENGWADELPLPVFLALRGQTEGNDLIKWWPTADAARSALSDALIRKHKESQT